MVSSSKIVIHKDHIVKDFPEKNTALEKHPVLNVFRTKSCPLLGKNIFLIANAILLIVGLTLVITGALFNLNTFIGCILFTLGVITLILSILIFLKYFKVLKGVSIDHIDQFSYIKKNVHNILSINSLNDPCIIDIQTKYTPLNSCYIQFSFAKGKYNYKLNKEPGFKQTYVWDGDLLSLVKNKRKFSSPMDCMYQSSIKAKQIIKDLQLNTLMIPQTIFQNIESYGLNYDLIQEEKLEGYLVLSENTAHLLSDKIIEQLSAFVCKTGIVIDWCNILINPKNPDSIYLTDLIITQPISNDCCSSKILESSLFGNYGNRGLINCLASKKAIDQVMEYFNVYLNSNEVFKQRYREYLQNRLDQIELYKNLHKLVNQTNSNFSRDRNFFLGRDINELRKCMYQNPCQCIDNNDHFLIPDGLESFLKNNIMCIIESHINNNKTPSSLVNYIFRDASYLNCNEICLFKITNYPEFVFKIYKGNSRCLDNQLAYDSYNQSIIVNAIIEHKKLALLKQPERRLLELNIDGELYLILISKDIVNVCDHDQNIFKMRSTIFDSLESLKQLASLLMNDPTIYINRHNVVFSRGEKKYLVGSHELVLSDIEHNNELMVNFLNIFDLVHSENVLYQLLIYSFEIGLIQMVCKNDDNQLKLCVEACLNKAINNIRLYSSSQDYIVHHSRDIELIGDIESLIKDKISKVLDLNAIARNDSLNHNYFNCRKSYFKRVVMKDALKEVTGALSDLLKEKRKRYPPGSPSLRRTITALDIKNSQVLSAYSQVYSDNDNKLSWFDQIIDALISLGYACHSDFGGFCI